MRKLFMWICMFVFATVTSYAQIELPAFFSSNMVLQQDTMVKLWGKAAVAEEINIKTSWNKKLYKTVANAYGHWVCPIQTPKAGGPFTITLTGKNKLVLENVMAGELWLCSGQSNMDMPVKGYWNSPILNHEELLLNAPNHYIRLFRVARKASAALQQNVEGQWEEADAASVNEFSAVGYQFAYWLQKHLDVPVGIIQSTWGGSPIEAWMDSATLQEVSKQTTLTGGATSSANNRTPSYLYNGMIAPLQGLPMAGVLWYQGEQNRFNYKDYMALQPAMVNAWRRQWGIGNWPFYFVQIAPMRYPETQRSLVPLFRESQLKLSASMLNVGMAVSIDAGDEFNIHPGKKDPIAKRLAYLALANHYHAKGITAVGPQYKQLKFLHDTAVVLFTHIPLGITSYGKTLTQFEIAGSNKVFYKANAWIKEGTVCVHSTEVKQPVAVRYAFTDWAIGELYGTDGLPVSSFRTDDW